MLFMFSMIQKSSTFSLPPAYALWNKLKSMNRTNIPYETQYSTVYSYTRPVYPSHFNVVSAPHRT